MSDSKLNEALPTIQKIAQLIAWRSVRRYGIDPADREDVQSQLVLSFLRRWPDFDAERASIKTFASRVMDRELMSILRHRLACSRKRQDIPAPVPSLPVTEREGFGIDVERALTALPITVRNTAAALQTYSTTEAAKELGCSRQIIHLRKRQIRAALESAGIGPLYFASGGQPTPCPGYTSKSSNQR